ncbi:transglutaminase-like domain-containing protein [Xenorhabdus ishibashii]|nr:transglutaminase family protein [Xenorhabdus ishibashii]
MMDRYLVETHLLDFEAESIQQLIESRHWRSLSDSEKVKSVYNFVRNDIKFGFNEDDSLTASSILSSGYGQCNTKSILFMALLRALKIPCRLHGFTIDKILQKGGLRPIQRKVP